MMGSNPVMESESETEAHRSVVAADGGEQK